MPIALDPKATFDYVLKRERELPPSEQTVFVLRGLTAVEEAELNDNMMATTTHSDELRMRSGSYQLTALRKGLQGWRNFLDSAGREVSFDRIKGHPRHVSDDCLDRLSAEDRAELADAILRGQRVTVEEGN